MCSENFHGDFCEIPSCPRSENGQVCGGGKCIVIFGAPTCVCAPPFVRRGDICFLVVPARGDPHLVTGDGIFCISISFLRPSFAIFLPTSLSVSTLLPQILLESHSFCEKFRFPLMRRARIRLLWYRRIRISHLSTPHHPNEIFQARRRVIHRCRYDLPSPSAILMCCLYTVAVGYLGSVFTISTREGSDGLVLPPIARYLFPDFF